MHRRSLLLTTLFLLTLGLDIMAQEKKANSKKPKDSGEIYLKQVAEENEVLKVKTKIKNPLDLRDPFKKARHKMGKRKGLGGKGRVRSRDGFYSNVENIENTPLEQLYVVGIMTGPSRRALIKVGSDSKSLSKETYILKEGMKLGVDQAEIKAILPGGIVLVEKIKNIYEQDEYLETIIPLISD